MTSSVEGLGSLRYRADRSSTTADVILIRWSIALVGSRGPLRFPELTIEALCFIGVFASDRTLVSLIERLLAFRGGSSCGHDHCRGPMFRVWTWIPLNMSTAFGNSKIEPGFLAFVHITC